MRRVKTCWWVAESSLQFAHELGLEWIDGWRDALPLEIGGNGGGVGVKGFVAPHPHPFWKTKFIVVVVVVPKFSS